jgi:hypothetical protein
MRDNRRNFLKQLTALSAVTSLTSSFTKAETITKAKKEGEGYTFLFQGDSITDGNRSRNNDWNHVMGHGYAYIILTNVPM